MESLTFDLIRSEPLPAAMNLALDATMLYRVAAARRRPVFWLWDWSESAVILGSYQSVANECDSAVAAERGFALARRISGGGAMMVEPDRTITWSLIVPEAVVAGMSFVDSFAALDAWAVRALREIGVPASYRPINDIASPSGKIAGAAQCRRKNTVLHHVTMAHAFDNALMTMLLRHGLSKPNPKGIPSAEKRVTPLEEFTALPRAAIMDHLVESFRSEYRCIDSAFSDDEREEAAARARETFLDAGWLYRVE